jgi:DNA-binding SARP family transcriptional activator/CheY-like chemotaxis protein
MPLAIRLLGELEIERGGERLVLPPSKKTRALLGYLAATGRPHRRERLCELFWEIPDDPRAALRWSLSKLRRLLSDEQRSCIVATRERVAFECDVAEVDLLQIRRLAGIGIDALSTDELAALADMFRGEFLEGNDLPHLHDFQAWCLAEREEIRSLQIEILSHLTERLSSEPAAALRHVRKLVEIDPYNERARADQLRILHSLGRRAEAEQHLESSVKVLAEVSAGAEAELRQLWRELQSVPRARASNSSLKVLPPSKTTAGRVKQSGLLASETREQPMSQDILVVDDEAATRQMVGDYLAMHGYSVRLCDGGEALRAAVAESVPDIVILDLHMPGEDGLSLVRFLRQKGPVPIIMLTATAGAIDRVVGLELGADDYVAKPCELRELLARVRSVLRARALGAASGGRAPAAL